MKVEELLDLLFPAITYYWCCQILHARAVLGRKFLVSVYEFWIFLVLIFSKEWLGITLVSTSSPRTDFLVATDGFLCQTRCSLYFQGIPVLYYFGPNLCSGISLFPWFTQCHISLLGSQRHPTYIQILLFSFWFHDLAHRAVLTLMFPIHILPVMRISSHKPPSFSHSSTKKAWPA